MRNGIVLVLALVACGARVPQVAGDRTQLFGQSELMSEYRLDPGSGKKLAWMHLLFVRRHPVVGVKGFGASSGISGAPDKTTFSITFHADNDHELHAQPVTLHDAATVEGGGRVFSLDRGNVFVADVSDSGAVTLHQLRRVEQNPEAAPVAILRAIKADMPRDALVQSLPER
jgi:hypothetical protein